MKMENFGPPIVCVLSPPPSPGFTNGKSRLYIKGLEKVVVELF